MAHIPTVRRQSRLWDANLQELRVVEKPTVGTKLPSLPTHNIRYVFPVLPAERRVLPTSPCLDHLTHAFENQDSLRLMKCPQFQYQPPIHDVDGWSQQ